MTDQIVKTLDDMYDTIGLHVVGSGHALYVFHYGVELRPLGILFIYYFEVDVY